jgi:hypothetical protein
VSGSSLTLSLKEAARVLGVGEQTLRDHMVDDGTAIELNGGRDRIRLVRIGRRCLVPKAELRRVLGEKQASPAEYLAAEKVKELAAGAASIARALNDRGATPGRPVEVSSS